MYILLPHKSSSIHELIGCLTQEIWEQTVEELVDITELPMYAIGGVEMQLPRFKLEYDIELRDVLSAMGMEVAFSPEADFSEMGPPPLWIDEVIHKSFVEVNEEGTEAAAATAVLMVDAGDWEPSRFVVNRPFFFAIRDDETGAVLFMGIITEPMQ